MIKAKLINEAGYAEAILGFGMAMKPRSVALKEWWTSERFEKVSCTARANAGRGKGHDKFLRMIQTWWYLDMPRYFSQEFATYKVGTTTASASTVHRLLYEPVTLGMFDTEELEPQDIEALRKLIDRVNLAITEGDKVRAKKLLPEGYMLEQVWNANYAVLNTIIAQRHNHKLQGWQELIDSFYDQVEYPELLIEG